MHEQQQKWVIVKNTPIHHISYEVQIEDEKKLEPRAHWSFTRDCLKTNTAALKPQRLKNKSVFFFKTKVESPPLRRACEQLENLNSQDDRYQTLHRTEKSVIKTTVSIPSTLCSPRKQAHFAPDILMCVSNMCGLLAAVLACLVISPSASLKGNIFVVSMPRNYTFLLHLFIRLFW